MTEEQLLDGVMDILRKKDIEIGAMDENYEPFNGLLSAEENKRCWKYLARQYVLNVLNRRLRNNIYSFEIDIDEFYKGWLEFLPLVEGVVRYGQKNKGIEGIVNLSGIARKTWIRFLD